MDEDNVTGRDFYIITKALFYAAHFIDGLPDVHQELSDKFDMMKILRARLGDRFMEEAEHVGRVLEEATGRPLDTEDYL